MNNTSKGTKANPLNEWRVNCILKPIRMLVDAGCRYLNTPQEIAQITPQKLKIEADDDRLLPTRDVILSIKPRYSNPIISGHKTVELRRRFPMGIPKGTIAYIYSTTPVRAIVGHAEISGVLRKSIEQIWHDHSQVAHIEKKDFDSYFEGIEHGFVLCFKNAQALKRKIELNELREHYNFQPPQSFLYAKSLLRDGLKNEHASISY